MVGREKFKEHVSAQVNGAVLIDWLPLLLFYYCDKTPLPRQLAEERVYLGNTDPEG